MTSSPESDALRTRFSALSDRVSANPDMALDAMREMFDSLQLQQAEPTDVTYEEVTVGGRAALWARPVGADPAAAILYSHGGGYIAFDMTTSRKLAGHLASAAGAAALVLDYRLAPEHPFPAALDDSFAAYRFLLDAGLPPDRLAVAGESAGGNLAAATLVRVREAGLPMAGSLVGFSPWLDLLGEHPTFDTSTDAFLTRPTSQMMAGLYLAGQDAHAPLANPLHADLHGFPPTYLTAGGDESLLGAVTAFAEALTGADVAVTLRVADGMQHAFQWMAGRAPEADRSIAEAGRWIRDHRPG